MASCQPGCSVEHPCRVSECPNEFALLALESGILPEGPLSTDQDTGNQSSEPGIQVEGCRPEDARIESQPSPPSSPPVLAPVSSQSPSQPVEPPPSTQPLQEPPPISSGIVLDQEASIPPPGQSSPAQGSAPSLSGDHDGERGADGHDPGILVYDNIITSDPTRVRIGEGNRAGGRVRGRVAGNRILR